MEAGFVYVDHVLRGVRWDAKYATWDNFTGARSMDTSSTESSFPSPLRRRCWRRRGTLRLPDSDCCCGTPTARSGQ